MERNQKNKEKGNGEGTLYKSSKTGLYVGQYVTNGKRKSIYQKKNEKINDFKKRFNNVLSSINQGTYIEKTNDTLNQILERYIKQKHYDGITSPRSYQRELETLEQIKKTCVDFINIPIYKVTAENIEDSKIKIKKYSKSCIEKIWRLLKKGFKIAYTRRKTPFNIMDDETLAKPISELQTKKIEALTINDEKKLRNMLNNEEKQHKYRNIIMMQLETGMRIGETISRSISDVNLKKNTLHIWNTLTVDEHYKTILGKHTKIYNKKTGIDKGKRTIPLNSETKKIINEIKKSNLRNMYNLLFWDYEKNTFISVSEINAWLNRINNKYKISKNKLSTHVLRHTRITRLQETGVALPVIQYLVGHVEGSKMTNDVYTSVDLNFVNNELKKVK